MEMSFAQYILNPMGKSNAVMSAGSREYMRTKYKKKFDNIMLRERSKIEYYLYTGPDNTYWIYAKIPSEVIKNFYYDVVAKFSATENIKHGGKDLFDYNVRFYSNDPAFVYTYAYVFNKNNLFINELRSKMSKTALKQSPNEKNPTQAVGYVKSIFFLYLLMQNRSLNKVDIFTKQSEPLDVQFLMYSIEEADKKIDERQEEDKNISHRKKVELKAETAKKLQKMGAIGDRNGNSRIAVRTTKTVGKISNTNSVKSTKKIGKK